MNWKKIATWAWLVIVLPPVPLTLTILADWARKGHAGEVLCWSTLTDGALWSAVLDTYKLFLHPLVFPFWTCFAALLLLLSCAWWLLRPGRFTLICTVFCGWVLCGLPTAVYVATGMWRYHSDMERLLELQQRFPQ